MQVPFQINIRMRIIVLIKKYKQNASIAIKCNRDGTSV